MKIYREISFEIHEQLMEKRVQHMPVIRMCWAMMIMKRNMIKAMSITMKTIVSINKTKTSNNNYSINSIRDNNNSSNTDHSQVEAQAEMEQLKDCNIITAFDVICPILAIWNLKIDYRATEAVALLSVVRQSN